MPQIKLAEKLIVMIRPTKERENAHIRWICRHRSLQLHSCPSHMKEVGLATKHLFQFFLLYSYVQVSPNRSPARHYSCLGQVLGSCNPTWLPAPGFQMPFPPTGESVYKLKGLPSPPFPTHPTNIHTHIHIHGKWNESKKFFSTLVAFFFLTNLERKLWTLSNASVPGARGLNVNNS